MIGVQKLDMDIQLFLSAVKGFPEGIVHLALRRMCCRECDRTLDAVEGDRRDLVVLGNFEDLLRRELCADHRVIHTIVIAERFKSELFRHCGVQLFCFLGSQSGLAIVLVPDGHGDQIRRMYHFLDDLR